MNKWIYAITATLMLTATLVGCAAEQQRIALENSSFTYDIFYPNDYYVTAESAHAMYEQLDKYMEDNPDVDWSKDVIFADKVSAVKQLNDAAYSHEAYYDLQKRSQQLYISAEKIKEDHDAEVEAAKLLAEQEEANRKAAEQMEAVYQEPEPVYYEEPVYYDYEPEDDSDYYVSDTAPDGGYSSDYLRRMGEVYDDGTRYTWYSQNVLPGGGLTELNNNGRHVSEEGYVVDADDYIAVASSDYEVGTILDVPFGSGKAKVYDCGPDSGTVDVYTDF